MKIKTSSMEKVGKYSNVTIFVEESLLIQQIESFNGWISFFYLTLPSNNLMTTIKEHNVIHAGYMELYYQSKNKCFY